MWFHKTGRFAVGDNGEPSIYIACAVHSEHLKLINCVNNMQDTRRQVRQLFLMSTQCKALNNLRVNAIHGHCCLRGPVRKSCNTQFRLSSTSARPQIAIISMLHQVTKQIFCTTDLASPGHLTYLFVLSSG